MERTNDGNAMGIRVNSVLRLMVVKKMSRPPGLIDSGGVDVVGHEDASNSLNPMNLVFPLFPHRQDYQKLSKQPTAF
jgi:hypothetical protein